MTWEMIPWVISRATGLTAVVALTLAMAAGLLIRTREPAGRLKGAGLTTVHRTLSGTALVAIAVHGTALLFDPTVRLSLTQLVVPGLIPYRPVWTALGVIAAELALVVHLSFRWRSRIGVHAWRRIHMLTYGVFALGVLHGIMAGTDSATPWAQALYGGAVACVCGLTGWRIATAPRARARRPAPSRGLADAS